MDANRQCRAADAALTSSPTLERAEAGVAEIYNVELMVNEYGLCFGEPESFPNPPPWEFSWRVPHPRIEPEISLELDPGEERQLPDFIWCTQTRHLACNNLALTVLQDVDSEAIWTYGNGELCGVQYSFVQVVRTVVDIDADRSIFKGRGENRYLEWPAFYARDTKALASNIFTVPSMGYLDVFAGAEFRERVLDEGLSGLRFVSV